ncbi:MAG: VCBS repeat-containing protein [Planctomycetales bacterium]|nr:VCBS repeat-containing protein [bacterium]UNM09914.1 MAG: VCBS repeat-containing protein [Planctomycetales bacterium]
MGRNLLVGCLGILILCCSCTKGTQQSADGGNATGKHDAGKQLSAAVPYAGYPASDANVEASPLAAGSGGGSFTQLDSAESGISFVSEALDNDMIVDDIGSQAGMAAADYDGDGDIDIYLCGISNDNLLFRNDGGMKFTDVTDEAGEGLRLAGELAESAVFFDINADGRLDLYVAVRGGANRLFVAGEDGRFTENAAAYGLASERSTIVSAVFDIDNDGDLDIYNANNRLGRHGSGLLETVLGEKPDIMYIFDEETGEVSLGGSSADQFYMDPVFKARLKPDSDEMYINNGTGSFEDRAAELGIRPLGWSLNALACDFNNDGWMDLEVSGDFDTPDWYYLNDGNGRLVEHGKEMCRINSFFGMGSDAGDLDRNGWMDYMVGDMSPSGYKDGKKQSGDMYEWRQELATFEPHQNMRNTVMLNRGGGWMSEAGALLGVKSTDWTWSIRIADLNSDGIHEILATNGYISKAIEVDERNRIKSMIQAGRSQKEIEDYIVSLGPFVTDDIIFTASELLKYSKAPDNWGLHDNAISCGASLQDYDGDGDLDMIINNTNAEAGVYRNDLDNGSRVLVDLRQDGPNQEAVGARVVAVCGDEQFMQDVIIARGYASTESSRIHLGLGEHQKIDALWIRWPGNQAEVLRDLDVNTHYTITRGSQLTDVSVLPEHSPLFSQEELGWNQVEVDTFEAEFEAEPLLPVRRSTLGTGVGVADINADGQLDVYFAGPAGQAGKLYYGRDGKLVASPMLEKAVDERPESMGVLFFEANGDGRPDLLLSSGGNEASAGSTEYIDRLMYNEGEKFKLAGMQIGAESSGSACASDIDNDGDLDLYIACRQKPGEYLRPGVSHIMLNDGEGNMSMATGRIAPGLAETGPVSDAIFTDVNGDGRQDLVLAIEFGSVEWWANNDGLLVRQGPISPSGTWQSLASADFDNDGDMDLLAGNYGLNTKYHPSAEKPYLIIADDFDNNGTRDLVEVKFGSDGTLLPGRGRSCSGYAIATVPQQFPTWTEFANASLEDIYGPVDQVAERFSAEEVRSCVFLNDGAGSFSMQPLPKEAQYSIVFGMATGDFDNDGNMDAWLNQNYRNTQPEETRWLMGYGCLLLGDGQGGFRNVEHMDSGILLNAEGRGAVAADLNGDNCLDILMSVSNSKPQLAWGQPGNMAGRGLMASLSGPAGNPAGIGAKLSLELDNGTVLHREVLGGHTYLSSYVGPQHFGIPAGSKPVRLTVSWPDGGSSEVTEFAEPWNVNVAR